MLESEWLQDGARTVFSLQHIITEAFYGTLLRGRCSFLSPVWMLQPMLFGYICSTVVVYILNRQRGIPSIIVLFLVILFWIRWSYVALAVVLGTLFRFNEEVCRL